MITYSKRNGYHYEDETTGERFALVVLDSLGGTTTTDIVGILDEESGNLVGWFYGATLTQNDPKQLDEIVPKYIKKHESAAPAVSYAFTKAGCKAFQNDVVSDFFDAMDNDEDLRAYYIHVTSGKRTIEIPMTASIYDGLCYWLDNIEGEEFEDA